MDMTIEEMVQKYRYTISRLHLACDTLATNESNVRERVRDAYLNDLFVLNSDDFPREFQDRWDEIKSDLNKRDPVIDRFGKVQEGSVQHTTRRMRNKTAQKIAIKIINLTEELDTHTENLENQIKRD